MSNRSADRVRKKKDCHPTLLLPPGLQTLFFTFTMLWTCPDQNGVDLVKVSGFISRKR